ncbi:MAG: acetate--CoA ligase family protein [Chloroflexota bacterium]
MTAEPSARTAIDLRPLFAPASVAVVGASPRSWIAQTVRDNLRTTGSSTRCHFVNPRYEELHGQPCFPSLDALPEVPDVVIVAVNPLRAAGITADAARAGVRAVVVPGGGVVEGGVAAAAMQDEVAGIAREHGIALVGPNCMGVWDLTTNTSAYIGDVSPYLRRGGVAGIAQSGSVTDAFIHSGSRIGFSRVIGSGSEVTLDLCDFLGYCLDDPETTSVILFVEGFKRPERFLALADHALEIGKPILAVKVGRSTQAQAAAVAHSGSLAGEARATDAALDAAGVIRCADLDELLEAAELVDGCRRTGRGVGRGRTGVVTVSTGEASLIADLAPRTGIDLPPIPDGARAAILAGLPTMGYVGNPLDPWGAADAATAYEVAFEALAASGAYDVLVLVHDFPYRSLPSEVATANEVTRRLLAATATRPGILPVYVSLTSGEPPAETKHVLDDEGGGAPMLRGTVEAFTAIASLAWWERQRERRLADGPWRPSWPALARNRTPWAFDSPNPALAPGAPVVLNDVASLQALDTVGLPVALLTPTATAEAAVAAAEAIGYPVVLKVDAEGLPHKWDAGAVRVGLADAPAVRKAATELLALELPAAATRHGLTVQRQAAPGIELIIGVRRDPQFGPVVLFGFGGILAEALDDVAIRLAPLRPADALEMVGSLRAARLLAGFRGAPPVDMAAVAALVVRLARAAVEQRDWLEVDLNPVISGPAGPIIVDALIVREEPHA